jgi:cation diffusion facilitator family transporter
MLRFIKKHRRTGKLRTIPDRLRRTAARGHLTRFAWLSIIAAVVTIALKTAAYLMTGSVGLLSDALEALVNLVAAIMALAMLIVSSRPPDDEYHFGLGKAEYFSSGLEGVLIIVAAAGISFASLERLQHPVALQALDAGLIASLLASLINLLVARQLRKVGELYNSITLVADAKHLMTDVWTSAGVLLGLVVVGVTGWQLLDPIIGLLLALNILWVGISLLRHSIAGLLDTTLPPEENAEIQRVLESYKPHGIQFHDLRTRRAGSRRFMTVHVLVPGEWSVQSGHDLLEQIERDIRDRLDDIHVVTHLEPIEDQASFAHEI